MTLLQCRPTASSFRSHLLQVLGEMTNFQPYVGVSRDKVCEQVAARANLDIQNPPWEVKTKADDLSRIIGFTFRNLREKYCGKNPYLTIQTKRSAPGQDDVWALSWAGVAEAQKAEPTPVIEKPATLTLVAEPKVAPPKVALSVAKEPLKKEKKVRQPRTEANVTSQWITANYTKLMKKMTQYLNRHPKFAVSRETQQIEDHIQHFLMNFIKRDGLKKSFDEGKNVTISHVCTYLRNNVYSQIRDNARRPVCRIFHGARTAKERDNYVSNEDWAHRVYVPGPFPTRIRNDDGETKDFSMEQMPDFAPVEQIEEKMAFDTCSEVIREMLIRRSPSEGEELAQLFLDRFVRDMTVKECARIRGINRNQAQAKLRVIKNYVEMEKDSLQAALGAA